ncbi:hypothetical protein [Rhodococcus sp. MEB064]|uniref:hypothetical protein n=1 Tax=Rhodococcus sp. MEB064 TaxID=1587522 RepID=UPI0018CF9B98|nr:hypothetical protein [Rhodococcus sp. MEB064]
MSDQRSGGYVVIHSYHFISFAYYQRNLRWSKREREVLLFHSHTQPWGTGNAQAWIDEKYGPGYEPVPYGTTFASFDYGEFAIMHRIVARRLDPYTGKYTLKSLPLHDAVLPEDLLFPIPLREEASNLDAFSYHWQQLTYAFKLPSPAGFPKLALSDEERELLEQYVTYCRRLAKYSVFNDKLGSLSMTTQNEETSVSAVLPSEEAFTAASATFRLINNESDEASFDKAFKILNKKLQNETSSRAKRGQVVLDGWKIARKEISKQMLETYISRKLVAHKEVDERRPLTFANVNPSNLILDFNYGDTLHWGKRRDALAELTADGQMEQFYKHCVLSSMLSLGHLYFGFTVAVESALGV